MWLRNEVIEGIQKLLSIRLKNAPPSDVIRGTVEVWTETLLSRPISWDEKLDKKRIKTAFTELCAISDTFPTPKDFLRVLAQRDKPLSLPRPMDNKISAENREMLNKLLEGMRK
ncbi:MAG: hypothetical protein ACO306_04540 [Flavobacteriaceae bacterium]